MNYEQQQPPRDLAQNLKSMTGWMVFASQVLAITLEVFLHKRFGARYLGAQALLAFFVILAFPGFYPEHDPRPLLLFLYAFLAMLFIARTGVLWRRMRGQEEHRYYTGWPRLCSIIPWFSESITKRLIEPMLSFALGAVCCEVSMSFGVYLMTAATGLYFSANANNLYEQNRAGDLNDAVIEQQQIAQRFREMRVR